MQIESTNLNVQIESTNLNAQQSIGFIRTYSDRATLDRAGTLLPMALKPFREPELQVIIERAMLRHERAPKPKVQLS